MAISHTAHTEGFSATKNLTTLPWAPSGADIAPREIYINPKLDQRIKEDDISTRGELMADVIRALGDMGRDSGFLDGARKRRRIAEKRPKWAQAHGGGISSSMVP